MPGAAARWSSSPCPRRRRRVNAKSAWILPSSSIGRRSTKCRREGRYRSGEAVGLLPAVVRRARTGLHSLRGPRRINTPYSPQLGWGLPKQARPRTAQNPPSQCRTDLLHPPIESTEISLAHPPQSERPARERSSTQPGSPRHEGAADGEGLPARLARPIAADRSRFNTLIRREPRHQVSAPPPARTVSI